jgi:DNA-directed RNA polymerase specialized sigma24 family protein
VRQLIREFLAVVPRSQVSTTITFPRPDGTPRTMSRAELSAAIDRMRPRQKHIIRLAVEERRAQEEVCTLLNGISLRTLQRDQAEALDLLAQL